MTQMKLYTEEQIFKYLLENGTIDLDSFILDMKPIELPSDEEISKYANFAMPDAEKIGGETYTAFKGFELGAKWMREKIKGDK